MYLQLRDEIEKYKVGAPARVGLVAPNDVVVPAGNTGLDPSQTSFFQASSQHMDLLVLCSLQCIEYPGCFSNLHVWWCWLSLGAAELGLATAF